MWLKTSAWVGVSERIVIKMHGETVKFADRSVHLWYSKFPGQYPTQAYTKQLKLYRKKKQSNSVWSCNWKVFGIEVSSQVYKT